MTRTIIVALSIAGCRAFSTSGGAGANKSRPAPRPSIIQTSAATTLSASVGNLHGESSCFLPVLQNDEEYIAPRIVQIAGSYPGVDTESYLAVTSEPTSDMGQWSYDFSDPNGPQMGTVALPGQKSVYETDDPVVLIADQYSLGVQLPNEVDNVDLVVLCDRSKKHFAERRFLVLELEESRGTLTIAAFESKGDLPENAKIMGHVKLVQIPWLPSMEKKKSGFMEENELF